MSIGNFVQSLTSFPINDKLNNRKQKARKGRVFHRKRSRESPQVEGDTKSMEEDGPGAAHRLPQGTGCARSACYSGRV